MSARKKKSGDRFFDTTTQNIFILIIIVAAFARFHALTDRPVHHDEAVRGTSLVRSLMKGDAWTYDPAFHGPFLMYVTALTFKYFGVNELTLRVNEALFGFFLMFLLLPLRHKLGKAGFLFSSALLAVSPALVMYSRFSIQTAFSLFFELASFLCVYFYSKTARNLYAYAGAVCLALGFTIKENMYVFVGLFGPYLLIRFILSLVKVRRNGNKREIEVNLGLWIRRVTRNLHVIIICILLFSIIHAAFFSQLGKNWENVKNAVITPFTFWQDRVQHRHTKEWSYYLKVLADSEYILVALGVLGVLWSLKTRDELQILFSYWALSSYLVYSFAIDFKEPWLIPHTLLPLIPLAGFMADGVLTSLAKHRNKAYYAVAVIILTASFGAYAAVSYDKNFVSAWSEDNLLTYVQATEDVVTLTNKIKNLSENNTGGKDVDVVYAFSENFPVYWYLQDYKKVKYVKNPVGGVTGWNGSVWQGKANLDWAADEIKEGERSAKIYSKDGADTSWYQIVKAEGGEQYVLSGWMKSKSIQNINASRYAKVFVRGRSNASNILGETKTMSGTKDWTYFEIPFTLPKSENYIRINLALAAWGYAKGTIWFDNLTLSGAELENPGFEEGEVTIGYPAVYIISSNDEHTLSPEYEEKYVKERYVLRPKIEITAYFRKDIL
ncbi:MAG: flippase activity-associated protein Agl23 [Candidatus Altiarchaeota archaeon]